ncbi:MAG: NAD-dependent epimerase/dehydratase family protein [Sulfuricurvum sp.]|nr:NAD-dependent epimerase/dehydratase family protein [Sulfuricurvum sp.]
MYYILSANTYGGHSSKDIWLVIVMLKGSKCLVTGHRGFIGTRLCDLLRHREIHLVGLDKENGGVINRKLLYEKCKGVDYIFHLGAISTVPACAEDLLLAHTTNITGTFNVLSIGKACNVKRVIFASSSVSHDARTMYAITKVVGEEYCKFFREMFKLPTSILRLYNVYGVGQSSDTAVIPSFIRKLKEDEPVIIEGSGTQSRDFIYIDDVANAMMQAADSGFDGCCDLGTGIDISITDLALLIGKLMSKTVHIKHIAGRVGDIDRSIANTTWYKPRYSLTEGLTKTIESWNK